MFLDAYGRPSTREATQSKLLNALVRGQVALPSESNLEVANQLGRRLLNKQVPPETIGEMMQSALHELCVMRPGIKLADASPVICEIITEVLMPYGLQFRIDKAAQSPDNDSNKNWLEVFDYSQMGMAIFDPIGKRILQTNKTFPAMLGHDLENIAELSLEELFRHYLQPERLDQLIVRCHEVEQLTETINSDMDQPFPHSLKICLALISSGDINNGCIVIILLDDSERFLNEIERDNLEGQLRQAHKMEAIGTLAGGIAHDFNNTLGAMIGYTELAYLNIGHTEVAEGYLKEVLIGADRAKLLIQQLLSFSRKDSSTFIAMDFKSEIGRALGMLSHTIPKMIEIKIALDENLYWIKGDPSQIAQIFLNLGTNARDAMPDGGTISVSGQNVQLRAEAGLDLQGLAPGKYVRVMFKDSGSGMEAEVLSHIFEPFYTTKASGKGTGLGLSTIYGAVKAHQGKISCQSSPNKGSVFEILLPAMEDMPSLVTASSPVADTCSHIGKGLVLVVDDEPALREIVKTILQKTGFRVLEASSGEDALNRLNVTPDNVDLIILDLNMPGMGGHKCLAEISERFPKTKVLVASGYIPDNDYQLLVDTGASGFLAKPYGYKEMLEAVERSLTPK